MDTKGVVLHVGGAAFGVVDRLRRASGADDAAEVVQNAVALYEWTRLQIRDGLEVGTMRNGKPVAVLVLPFKRRL